MPNVLIRGEAFKSVIIGEKINETIRVKKVIENKDKEFIRNLAVKQVEAGNNQRNK